MVYSLVRSALAAAGLAVLGSVAWAQPFTETPGIPGYDPASGARIPGSLSAPRGTVSISGATLFISFFRTDASTNDAADVDGDGLFGFNTVLNSTDQLALSVGALGLGDPARNDGAFDFPPFDPMDPQPGWRNGWWVVWYRESGSVNGIRDLIAGQFPSVGLGRPAFDLALPPTPGNQLLYNRSGPWFSAYGTGNPDSLPALQPPVDLAPSDVPASWAFQGDPGTVAWSASPLNTGYGRNPINQNNLANKVSQQLVPANVFPAGSSVADLYATPIAGNAVSYIANVGTGVFGITKEQAQWLFVTGRFPDGRDYHAVTRDVGSGTRNAIMNTTGIDPSWGQGENDGVVDPMNPGRPTESIARDFVNPLGIIGSDMFSSSRVDVTVACHRLAIGYNGSERSITGSARNRFRWLPYDPDNAGPQGFIHATRQTIPDGDYPIVAIQHFVTVGNPAQGFVGHQYDDGMFASDTRSWAAAAYINNITTSLLTSQIQPPAFFTPADFLIRNFFFVNALEFVPQENNPTNFIPNPTFSASLKATQIALSNLDTGNVPGGLQGYVPRPQTIPGPGDPLLYQKSIDNRMGGVDLVDIAAGSSMTLGGDQSLVRNWVAGDFDYATGDGFTGKADLNDIAGMVAAWLDPVEYALRPFNQHGGVGNNFTGYVSIDLLGDFNGDGQFTQADIRYFCNGLAVDPVSLRLLRQSAYLALDNAAASHPTNPVVLPANILGVTFANGRTYQAGDARYDVNGDGVVEAADFAAVAAILQASFADFGIPAGPKNWAASVNEAWVIATAMPASQTSGQPVGLNADVVGDDLIIDAADLFALAQVTHIPANLAMPDLVVDLADFNVASFNFGKTGAVYAEGDVDGTTTVDSWDLAFVLSNLGTVYLP